MRRSLVKLILAGLLGVAANSQAGVITLQPDDGKDTQLVDGFLATSNWGDFSDLVTNWADNSRSIGLVEFDLSGLPAGAVLTSVTLSLFHQFNDNSGSRYDVFRVTSPWDEGTVTFDTAPTIDSTAGATLVILDAGTGVFRDWDITALVAGWVSGAFTNNGLWVEEIPVAGNATAYFSSSDLGGALTDPKLTINFQVPEPGTLALLGIALLGLSAARRLIAKL